ncbi:phosphoribosyltransferase-like protein [Crocosphaera sp.]|uniref:phosphoribosyltransferase-like protein n=1 Tax=Crocosphaera sp. TaxID=2729996 RepID=UPI003F1FEA06|nr:hypothetical protein [Crocosphaera sp.]
MNFYIQRQNLLYSIANTIKDYRRGEIEAITRHHVNKWVNQFELDDQLIILSEMDHILKKRYLSKIKIQDILRKALTSKKIFGDDTSQIVTNLEFLDIQRKGNSQRHLLELANNIIQQEYKLSRQDCGNVPRGYIYLDDCLFSGNTVLYDIQNWLPNAREGVTLYCIFLAAHTNGLRYLKNKLDPKIQAKNITVDYRAYQKFSNIPWEEEKFECLWPKQVEENELINIFVNSIKERCKDKNWKPRIFRSNGVPQKETIFSSPESRNIVEKAFLKAGAYIVSLPREAKPEMRPMGYEKLDSLGFGAFFITYRNIANNCPLALWWGDTSYPDSHPFSKWYPLFPRQINEEASNFW